LALRRLPAPIKRLVAPLRGNAMFEGARNLIARPVRYPPLPDDVRRYLVDYYQDDVEDLARILGRELPGWTMPAMAA
ncbi:MAG TPA: sulfotransferase, partial [Sphingobium sp.]|nr:sulfotransferase [Sphingobium sp.]